VCLENVAVFIRDTQIFEILVVSGCEMIGKERDNMVISWKYEVFDREQRDIRV
jgi:hypothetical protein